MTLLSPHASFNRVSYAGEAVVAAGAAHDILRLSFWPGTNPNGRVVIIPFYSGIRWTGLPSTLDTTSPGPDPEKVAVDLIARGYGVVVPSLPVARGYARTLPGDANQVEFIGTLALTNVGAVTINSASLTGGGSYVVTVLQQGSASQNEKVEISASGTVTGGTFTITFGASTTAPIAYNAQVATVQAALHALASIGTGNSLVTSGTSGKETGNPVSDPIFNIDFKQEADGTPHYGPAYDGNGMIVPAPNDLFGSLPTSYTATPLNGSVPHPIQDPRRLNMCMAISMAVQFIIKNAVAMGLNTGDPYWLGGYGGSGAADALAWVFFGPNRGAYHFPSATALQQDGIDTKGAIKWCALHYWQSKLNALPLTMYISSIAKRPAVGGTTHYDTQSVTIDEAGSAQPGAWGALYYGGQPAVLANNQARPTHLAAEDVGGQGAPFDDTTTERLCTVHDIWFCAAMAKLLEPAGTGKVELLHGAATAASFIDEAEDAGIVFDGSYASNDDLRAQLMAWLAEATALPEPIEEQVIRQVETALRAITSAAGYRTQVNLVQRWESWNEEAGVYPAILVEALGAAYDDASFHPHVQGALTLALGLLLEGHVDRTARVSRFIADVRKGLQAAFLADQFAQLAVDLHIIGSQRLTTDVAEQPVCGAVLTVEVSYRNRLENTYAQ